MQIFFPLDFWSTSGSVQHYSWTRKSYTAWGIELGLAVCKVSALIPVQSLWLAMQILWHHYRPTKSEN